MKHAVSIALVFLVSLSAFGQTEVKLFYEREGQKVNLYANNELFCPASVKLDLKITNMQCDSACPQWILLPPRAQKYLIARLSPSDIKKPLQFGYGYRWFFGNVLAANHNPDQPYYLPFEKGKTYGVVQGYNGPSSHKNQNALDFNLPEGSLITSAREGVVARVIQNFNTGCPEERCKEFNNYIVVYHSDGTFAEYTHIRFNGSVVQPGTTVKAGQALGYSGNTGWSRGPHLHFVVYTFTENGINTIPTKFKHNNTLIYLQPTEKYTRNYD